MANEIEEITPEWNPETRLVWSKAGSQREIPAVDYDKFIGEGWSPSAPQVPTVPQEVIPQAGATVEDILGQDAYGDELAGAEAGYLETFTPEYRQQSREQSDADIMKKYQQEIDALEAERVSAMGRITSQYGDISKGRQGTISASAARRGLAGSTFAEEQSKTTRSATQREEDAAHAYSSAQYDERRRSIMGLVRTAQADEAKIRYEAAQLGSQARIEEIRGRKTRSDERVSTAIQNLLGMEADVEDEELMAEVAEGLGISVNDLQSRYETIKSEAEEATRIEDLERRKLEAEGQTVMKPGELLYDSEGNLIAEGTKEAGKTITLKPGEVVVDAEGNTIAQGLEEEEELLSPTEAEKLGVAYGTTKSQAADMGIFMTGDEDMIGSLSGDQWDRLVKLRTETAKDPDVKQFIEIRNSYDRLKESGRDPSAAGDLALIFNYMKMLDPGSVVRESEFATAAASGSLGERFKAAGNKLVAGERLSDEMRKDFMDRGKRLYQPRKRNYDKAIDFWKAEADEIGVPMDRVIRDYTTPTEQPSSELWSEGGGSGDIWADWEDSGGSQDFNNGGSGTPTATTDTKKVAQAIGQFESGGNYTARGPVVTSGQYKGEKAAGKYQVMPGNIPSWSKEALGKSISLQTFLDRPDLQDKIAEHKMGKILAQYGNIEDVASVWFSGRPIAKAGQAKDVLGTTVPSYVKNISSIFNRLS